MVQHEVDTLLKVCQVIEILRASFSDSVWARRGHKYMEMKCVQRLPSRRISDHIRIPVLGFLGPEQFLIKITFATAFEVLGLGLGRLRPSVTQISRPVFGSIFCKLRQRTWAGPKGLLGWKTPISNRGWSRSRCLLCGISYLFVDFGAGTMCWSSSVRSVLMDCLT